MAKIRVIKKLVTKSGEVFKIGEPVEGIVQGQEMVCESILQRRDSTTNIYRGDEDNNHYLITATHTIDEKTIETTIVPVSNLGRLIFVVEEVQEKENNPEANVQMEKA